MNPLVIFRWGLELTHGLLLLHENAVTVKDVICISEFPDIRESRIASRPNRYIPGYPPAYPGIPG